MFLILPGWLCLADPASALTRRDIKARAWALLGADSTSTYWPAVELNDWVNDGIRYASAATLAFERETTLVAVAGQTDYAMPSDYIRLIGVVFADSGNQIPEPWGIPVSAPADMGSVAKSAGKPRQIEDLGEDRRAIRLTPASNVEDRIRVIYAAYGSTLSADSVECDLPDALQRCLPNYVASQAWQKTRTADPYWQKFVNMVQPLMRNRAAETQAPAQTRTPQ